MALLLRAGVVVTPRQIASLNLSLEEVVVGVLLREIDDHSDRRVAALLRGLKCLVALRDQERPRHTVALNT